MSRGECCGITDLLRQIERRPDDPGNGTDRLFELIYDDLRRIAARLMRRERVGHTLQPTALVNEAYLRLVGQRTLPWQDRALFLRAGASAMRRILVDHARRRRARKRGGGIRAVTLDEQIGTEGGLQIDILILDDALTRLSSMDERMARVVELRVFAGMNMDEIAHIMLISRRTAYDEWGVAKKWLARELSFEKA